MTRVHNVTLARIETLTVNCSEGRKEKQARSSHLQHEQTFATEEGFSAAPTCVNIQARIARKI